MKGKINISRDGKKAIWLSVEDDLSGITIIQIEMTPDKFALCLTGLSDQDCEFELFNSPFIGKRREYKNVDITIPGEGWQITEEQKSEAIAPFQVDGWRVFRPDTVGADRYKTNTPRTYQVTLIRFVEAGPNDHRS